VLQNFAEMYSAADYVEMLIIFGECGRNAREAARVFSDRFPDRPSPDHKTILRVLARAQETGKVLLNRYEIGGGARTARTLANEEAILNIVEEDGTRSIREIAQIRTSCFEGEQISSFPLYSCGRVQRCFNHRNLQVWSYDNPRATYSRAFQCRFSVNLWSGLVGDSVVKLV
jgi:hypothetical protein